MVAKHRSDGVPDTQTAPPNPLSRPVPGFEITRTGDLPPRVVRLLALQIMSRSAALLGVALVAAGCGSSSPSEDSGAVPAHEYQLRRSDPTNWDEAKSRTFNITSDGEMHDYEIDMSTLAGWNATITGIRLDPGAVADATIEIDTIEFPCGPLLERNHEFISVERVDSDHGSISVLICLDEPSTMGVIPSLTSWSRGSATGATSSHAEERDPRSSRARGRSTSHTWAWVPMTSISASVR